jgi:hypothetical protein
VRVLLAVDRGPTESRFLDSGSTCCAWWGPDVCVPNLNAASGVLLQVSGHEHCQTSNTGIVCGRVFNCWSNLTEIW